MFIFTFIRLSTCGYKATSEANEKFHTVNNMKSLKFHRSKQSTTPPQSQQQQHPKNHDTPPSKW